MTLWEKEKIMNKKNKQAQQPIKVSRHKTLIFRILFVLLAISVVYASVMLVKAPSGTSLKAYEHVKSDYVLMILQCLVGMIIIFLPSQVEKHLKLIIPDIIEILYFLFLFCAIYLGEVRDFYYKVPFWDSILHFFSATMLGALGFILVNYLNNSDWLKLKLTPFFVSLFAFCFATTCGVIWEIYEYMADKILGTNMQKFITADGVVLTGHAAIKDTMNDMMVNMLGAFIIVVIGYISLKRQFLIKKHNNMDAENATKELIKVKDSVTDSSTITTNK